jgi:hypothetical protein
MGLSRKSRRLSRRAQAAETKEVNRGRKTAERARRDARLLERVKSSAPPYTPEVMSWLSEKLGKKSSQITPEDVARLTS